MSVRKSWLRRNRGPRSRWRKDWYPPVATAERTELALRAYGSVALRKRVHRLPHGPAECRPEYARLKGTRWTCRSEPSDRVGCRSIRSFHRTRLNSSKRRGLPGPTSNGRSHCVGRGPTEEQGDEVLGRRSGCRRKLAARLVHLARQCVDGQCQGARVFPEALSGNSRQRGWRGHGEGVRQGSRLARDMHHRERWIWSST